MSENKSHPIKKKVKRVFAGDIPFELTIDEIRDIFSTVGPVVNIEERKNPNTNKRDYCFIEYPDYETAESAVRNLNQYPIKGRKLKVNYANKDKTERAFEADNFSDPEEFENENSNKDLKSIINDLPDRQKYYLLIQMQALYETNPTLFRYFLENDKHTVDIISKSLDELKLSIDHITRQNMDQRIPKRSRIQNKAMNVYQQKIKGQSSPYHSMASTGESSPRSMQGDSMNQYKTRGSRGSIQGKNQGIKSSQITSMITQDNRRTQSPREIKPMQTQNPNLMYSQNFPSQYMYNYGQGLQNPTDNKTKMYPINVISQKQFNQSMNQMPEMIQSTGLSPHYDDDHYSRYQLQVGGRNYNMSNLMGHNVSQQQHQQSMMQKIPMNKLANQQQYLDKNLNQSYMGNYPQSGYSMNNQVKSINQNGININLSMNARDQNMNMSINSREQKQMSYQNYNMYPMNTSSIDQGSYGNRVHKSSDLHYKRQQYQRNDYSYGRDDDNDMDDIDNIKLDM